MGKKAKAKRNRQIETVNKGPQRTSPNWPLLAISIVGMALTGYLTYTSIIGASVKGCSAGSGCDVVLNSHWATTFGLPTALWGFLAYAGLAGIAFIKSAHRHWRLAWTAAFLGVAFSIYLTAISLTVLNAACPYCLTSLSLMIGTLALTTFQRPSDLPSFKWKGWMLGRVAMAAAFVFALHLQYVVVPTVPESPMARPLADHLTAIGAKFYGASWCEHCQRQKSYFGKAASRLPYVECKAGGPSAPLSIACNEQNIASFPTWIVKDKRVEAVLSLSDLADMSGFKMPPAPPN